jgi:ubiquitin C-terminal hydrolase
MAGPHQSIVLLEDEDGDAKCVGINGNHKEKIAEERPGCRGRQERSEQRRKNISKKSASATVGEKELQELMRLSEYEVVQDPYRGIGFLNNRNNNNDEENTKMVDADSNEMRIAPTCREGKIIDKIVTPWDICQWGILTMPKNNEIAQQEEEKISHEDMNIDDNKMSDSFLLDPGNAKYLVQNLTESCCPSISAWTKEHLDEGNKKKQQSQRKTTGKKRNRSSCEQEGNNASISTRSACLGIRPSDGKYHCPCDSNPFCLGSMGGIMNELLEERWQMGITISTKDEDESVGGENASKDLKRGNFFESGGKCNNGNGKNRKNDNAETEIVDVDQNTKTLAVGTESKESNSVFAFMGGNKTSLGFSDKTKHLEKVKIEKNTENSATTIATFRQLGPGWSKPEIGEPAEVYSSKRDIINHHFNEEGYSQTTKDEIDMLRRFENVDVSKVKKFVKNIFELLEHSNSNTMTMNEYIQAMTEWHKSLLFVNPTTEARHSSSNNITIALPPGIQNLGATCYLNTQLQCLAQNPVFLDGIFSWRPVDATHKMNGVMAKLQTLLAQLLVGGNGKYTSLEFSNALGIQHNEQQDPNEFARLLFDRMEESFQQCSTSGSVVGTNHDNVNSGDGLGKLLQRIFHGTTTYETICLKCGKTSVRSEGFMDLNLPIVQRPYFEDDDTDDIDDNKSINISEKDGPAFVKRKRRKKGMIEKAFQKQKKSSSGNTDVQYCFDQYTKTETLDGDNQYFCDDCNCKQDAKRVMSLTELPPVLNIQLSRYVFDREKFVKKKLTDKVRLPTVLTIDQHGSGAGGNEISLSTSASKKHKQSKKKYVLCAVMRHQGTSAYSGHYVAEAMDWTNGQWYEFNDETVKVLPAPSNSYVPQDSFDSEDEEIENENKSAGSQDAYNMYYVDEEYLADRAIITMLRNQRLNSIQNGFNKNEYKNIDVLSNLIREKMNRYSVLTE